MVRVTQGILGLKKKRLKEYFHNCPNLLSAIDSRGLTTVQEVYDYYSKQYQWIVE
jgi:predicted solute-binding protein